jgi:hypothetical protein
LARSVVELSCAADFCDAAQCPICGANQTDPVTSKCKTGNVTGEGLVNKTGHYGRNTHPLHATLILYDADVWL